MSLRYPEWLTWHPILEIDTPVCVYEWVSVSDDKKSERDFFFEKKERIYTSQWTFAWVVRHWKILLRRWDKAKKVKARLEIRNFDLYLRTDGRMDGWMNGWIERKKCVWDARGRVNCFFSFLFNLYYLNYFSMYLLLWFRASAYD